MDMNNEIIELCKPEIKSLEMLYTNIFKAELQKIAGEYEDNNDEKIATQQVIDSFRAIINFEDSSIIMSFEYDNEPWFEIMNEGMEAPEVTGEDVELPQGGTKESNAAVTGGEYLEGAESGSMAKENAMKIINSLFPDDVRSIILNNPLVSTMIAGRLKEEIQKMLGGNVS